MTKSLTSTIWICTKVSRANVVWATCRSVAAIRTKTKSPGNKFVSLQNFSYANSENGICSCRVPFSPERSFFPFSLHAFLRLFQCVCKNQTGSIIPISMVVPRAVNSVSFSHLTLFSGFPSLLDPPTHWIPIRFSRILYTRILKDLQEVVFGTSASLLDISKFNPESDWLSCTSTCFCVRCND